MPQDAITLKKMSFELNAILQGAKVNKITQPTQDELIFLVYAKNGISKLIVSANAVTPRVGFTSIERKNPIVAPAFCMLARKHLLNATIKACELLGNERIIKITLDGKNDFLENTEKELYCEIMGKYSNVILCENDIILGTLKPSSLDFSKNRALLAGAKYALPKSQEKIDFENKEEALQILSNFNGGDLAQYIFNFFKGFSSLAATEICQRAFGKPTFDSPLAEKINADAFYLKISDFLNDACPTPCVVYANDGAPIDYFFTDYLSVKGEKKYFDCLCSAEKEFFDLKQSLKIKNELKTRLLSIANSALKKERKKLQTILEKENSCIGGEKYKIFGELITANLYKIKRGDKELVAPNYYADNEEITIPLDESLSPTANAQKYFKKYAKIKNTVKAIQPQKEQTLNEIDYIESVLSEINSAQTTDDLGSVEEELKQSGMIKSSNEKNQKIKKADLKISYRVFEYGGFKIRAGKNNVQNDKLTAISKPADTWLHAKNYHSAHVVIESNGKHMPDEIILIAAEICAFYSEVKGGGKVEVDYALKKYVKKPPQAKPGAVLYTDFKTILVIPDSHKNLEI